MIQKYTSANTSINNVKLPTAFTKIRPFGHVCDYGCGKYIDHIREYCRDAGALSYCPIDPYNQSADTNQSTITMGRCHGYDTIYCCNVLNVIDDISTIEFIVDLMCSWLTDRGRIIIQIYEGNKSGVGRCTKKDCYQRNEKRDEYMKYMPKSDKYEVYTKYTNMIIIERK